MEVWTKNLQLNLSDCSYTFQPFTAGNQSCSLDVPPSSPSLVSATVPKGILHVRIGSAITGWIMERTHTYFRGNDGNTTLCWTRMLQNSAMSAVRNNVTHSCCELDVLWHSYDSTNFIEYIKCHPYPELECLPRLFS